MTAAAAQVERSAGRLERTTYTVQEVADLAGISERHLRNLLKRGEFPVRPLANTGRRRVFPRPEIQAWLRGHHPSQQAR